MNERILELIKAVGGISYDDDGKELSPMLVGNGRYNEAINNWAAENHYLM